MPLEVSWSDIGWRLLLTIFAGALIGMNREEHGQGGWHARVPDSKPFVFLKELMTRFGLSKADWKTAT
jgi:hypothetical protein